MKSASVWDHVDAGIKFKGLLRIQLSVKEAKSAQYSHKGSNEVLLELRNSMNLS